DGERRRRLPPLRPLRRALPDGRVGHAEVPARYGEGRLCGERAMTKTVTNDFVVKFANVNGSGSASANGMFAKAVMRMGVPVGARNIFPSNIQGLPTWYEVRVSEDNFLARRGGVDLMVAMNPQTWDQDLRETEQGGFLLYDSTKAIQPSKF